MTNGVMDSIKLFLSIVEIFFIAYLILYSTFLFISTITGSITLYRKNRENTLKNIFTNDYYIPVSIIVPAYNEDKTVVETVNSLLALDYRLYEIIVVNDGSTDETAKRLIESFHMHLIRRPIQKRVPSNAADEVYEARINKIKVTLINKKNGGKADSLNMGINASQYPYFICMDADSVLQYDSLTRIVKPILENDNVVAVGGVIRPANGVSIKNGRVIKFSLPKSIIASMQVLEYDRSFLASRILFDKFNGSLIISGAFGLFKKETVVAVGGYERDTIGEDMELVVKLHNYCVNNDTPYLIKYAPETVCWTQVPEKLSQLCKQRKRWHIGLFQSMWAHRVMLFNPKYGATSMISFLYFLLYELLSPIIELFGIMTIILAFIVELINVKFMILFFIIYAIYGSILTMTIFLARTHTLDLKVTFDQILKAAFLCLFEITFLRFALALVRMSALIGYKRNGKKWEKLERTNIDFKA